MKIDESNGPVPGKAARGQKRQTIAGQKRSFVTTSIPYVNSRPHLGHAQEFVQADALVRYLRLAGEDVRFLTGTDENSLKNALAAEQEGISVEALVERNAKYFKDLLAKLDVHTDDFIRTSAEQRHVDGARKLWEAVARNGDIYKDYYRGLYCVGCEQFYTPNELNEDGLCPDHLVAPELVEEENYFFRLTRYRKRLQELIESGKLQVVPETRKNEVLSLIRTGLSDFSISRSRQRAHGWGVPVPGDPSQVMYVWFDALGNYISALDYSTAGPLFEAYWTGSDKRIHVIGKGITRFHAVYWPAMLLSAGVRLPTTIFVHGYVTAEGRKLSKSLGNAGDPIALTDRYGADVIRYYLLREVPSTADGDFSLERLERAYNSDLADQLGNLHSRVTAMIERYYGGTVPAPGGIEEGDARVLAAARALPRRLSQEMGRFDLQAAIAAIWDLVAEANRYAVEAAPWQLAKGRSEAATEARLASVLYNLLEALRIAALACKPFLPATADRLARDLGAREDTGDGWLANLAWGRTVPGSLVRRGEPLFPKATAGVAAGA